MYLVLCETDHGKRYHVWTSCPEAYADRVHVFGPVDDYPEIAHEGVFEPDAWDEDADVDRAFGGLQ